MEERRAKLLMVNPNTEFMGYLEEFMDEAIAARDWTRVTELQMAMVSLQKFPFKLNSPLEAQVVQFFTTPLLNQLLKKVKEKNSEEAPKMSSGNEACSSKTKPHGDPTSTIAQVHQTMTRATTRPAEKRAFDEAVLSTKQIPQGAANKRHRSKVEASKSGPESDPPASSCQALSSQIATHSVTLEGIFASANVMPYERQRLGTSAEYVNEPPAGNSSIKVSDEEDVVIYRPFIDPLDSMHVVLYGDTQEKGITAGLRQEFDQQFLKCDVRRLKVGDFVWVILGPNNVELVLPLIVERKRLDDLSKSIFDGRFHEQKFRLQATGIPRILLLIENHQVRNKPKGLLQSIYSTLVRERYHVLETDAPEQTINSLTNLTKLFQSVVETKTIQKATDFGKFCWDAPTWYLAEFNELFEKMGKLRVFTVREMLTKQLVQLHGMSADKAWAITSVYGSTKVLIEAFQNVGPTLLSDLKYGLLQKRIGANISSVLHKFYTS